MDEIVTCLEMTAPTQLVPARRPPARLELEEVGPAAAPLVRSIYVRIWDALASGGRMDWSDVQWEDELSRPRVRAWVARVEGELAGFVELEPEPNGDVGIEVFGLVPEFIGNGFGGALLTWATKIAWELTSQSGGSTKRVWVQTSSGDHSYALPNYERRGFRIFRVDRRPLDLEARA
jgi:GNAT superfamily N-acetyltransferase